MMVTPRTVLTSPGRVSAQLPPASAARSTITEPGRIWNTASAVTRMGARLPGTSAVVITTPATPAPRTNTLAGVTTPAAVMSNGKKRGKAADARITARYPEIVLMDESASIS